jgi:hypothetical protein
LAFNPTALLKKNILPRRANHRHIDIIARSSEPASSETGRGLFYLAHARERAGHAGVAKSTSARGPAATICDQRIARGIGFAPEMIASAIMPHIFFTQGKRSA